MEIKTKFWLVFAGALAFDLELYM